MAKYVAQRTANIFWAICMLAGILLGSMMGKLASVFSQSTNTTVPLNDRTGTQFNSTGRQWSDGSTTHTAQSLYDFPGKLDFQLESDGSNMDLNDQSADGTLATAEDCYGANKIIVKTEFTDSSTSQTAVLRVWLSDWDTVGAAWIPASTITVQNTGSTSIAATDTSATHYHGDFFTQETFGAKQFRVELVTGPSSGTISVEANPL